MSHLHCSEFHFWQCKKTLEILSKLPYPKSLDWVIKLILLSHTILQKILWEWRKSTKFSTFTEGLTDFHEFTGTIANFFYWKGEKTLGFAIFLDTNVFTQFWDFLKNSHFLKFYVLVCFAIRKAVRTFSLWC